MEYKETNSLLVKKFNIPGPRYTSYPTVPYWNHQYSENDLEHALKSFSENKNENGFSLYIHIPFCQSRCSFCGCNVVISKKEEMIDRYLRVLEKEQTFYLPWLKDKEVLQLHLGGGTPSYLRPVQLKRLLLHLHKNLKFSAGAELSIEIHPNV